MPLTKGAFAAFALEEAATGEPSRYILARHGQGIDDIRRDDGSDDGFNSNDGAGGDGTATSRTLNTVLTCGPPLDFQHIYSPLWSRVSKIGQACGVPAPGRQLTARTSRAWHGGEANSVRVAACALSLVGGQRKDLGRRQLWLEARSPPTRTRCGAVRTFGCPRSRFQPANGFARAPGRPHGALPNQSAVISL